MKKLISIMVVSLLIIKLIPIGIVNASDEFIVEIEDIEDKKFEVIEDKDEEDFNNAIEDKDSENKVSGNNIYDNLIINKTIEEVKDNYGEDTGEYEVTLNISIRGIDIIFAIDNSQSMTQDVSNSYLRNKYKEVVDRIGNVFTNVIEVVPEYRNFPVRVGATVFNGNKDIIGSLDDSQIVFEFTRDKSKIRDDLYNLNSFGDRFDNKKNLVDVVNYEAGLLRAKDMLKDDALSKYIVFYTDGPPTTGIEKKPQSKLEEDNINYYEDFKEAVMNIRDDILKEDIKIFSIGDIRGTFNYQYENNKDRDAAIVSLKDMVNSISTFKLDVNNNEEFIASNSGNFDAVFKRLQTELYKDMDRLIENQEYISNIKGLTIIDDLKEQYKFVEDSYKIYNLENKEITNVNEGISVNDNTLKIENLNIDSNGLVVKYRVKAIDKNYYENNAEISSDTWIEWLENEEINKKFFNKVLVEIKPVTLKKGSLVIETIVENNIGAEHFQSEKYVSFLSNVESNNKYTLINEGNNNKTIDFYLYDDINDILTDVNSDNTYIKCGDYKIVTQIPINHEINSIKVRYDENQEWKEILDEDYLKINNNNRRIYIKINYNIINKNYWNDKKQYIQKITL